MVALVLVTVAAPALFAGSAPPGRPPATQIRQQIEEILSQPEYQTEYPMWLANLLDRAFEFLVRLVRAIFDNPALRHLYATRPVVYWLLSLAIFGVLFLLLYHIFTTIRSAFGGRRRQKPPAERPPLVLTSPGELRHQARALALRGEFAAALVKLYQACLRHLERQGHLRYRDWLTNGEYLQALRPQPDLFGLFMPLTAAVNRVIYGHQPLAGVAYNELDALADQLWQRAGD